MNREELLFKIYKDQEMTAERKNEIRKNFPEINTAKLFVKINNYQVDKYGSTIYVKGNEISEHRDKKRAYKVQKIERYRKGKEKYKDENYKRMEREKEKRERTK